MPFQGTMARPWLPPHFAPPYATPPILHSTPNGFSQESPITSRQINADIDKLPEAPSNPFVL